MAKNTLKPELNETQKALMAELETLREHLFRHAGSAEPEDPHGDQSQGMLALVRLCRGLTIDDFEALVHEMGLVQWLPVPLGQSDFPFLSQLQKYLEDVSLQSSRDSLTLLINRRAFERYVHLELQRSRREGLALSLAYLHVDGFDALVKQHGRTLGDQVLLGLARLLLKHKRAYDSAAHLDADRFALLLPGVGLFEAQMLLERLQKNFGSMGFGPDGAGPSVHASFSAGLTHVRGPNRVTVNSLMQMAEEALIQARVSAPGGISMSRPTEDKGYPKDSMVQIDEKRFLFSGCD